VLAVFESWPQLSEVGPGWFLVVLAGQVLSFGCLFVLQRMALRTKAWFPVITSQLAGNVARPHRPVDALLERVRRMGRVGAVVWSPRSHRSGVDSMQDD
jgi:hypothetical protein